MIRWLIPDALPGTTMEDSGAARLNYAKLDRAGQPARVRLNSTVLNVRHDGDPVHAKEVVVSYSRFGKMYDVRAKSCIMACWNMFIPYLIPDIPAKQKEALAYGVKGPLVYTSVAVKNWQAWHKLGINSIRRGHHAYTPACRSRRRCSLGDRNTRRPRMIPSFFI